MSQNNVLKFVTGGNKTLHIDTLKGGFVKNFRSL